MAFCYLRVVGRGFARVILPELILDRSAFKHKKRATASDHPPFFTKNYTAVLSMKPSKSSATP